MKTKIFLALQLIFLLLFFSCTKNSEIEIDNTNLLIGNWSEASYKEGEIIFKRVDKLPEEAYGVSFKKESNQFLERTSGFCGTPPLSFFTIEGKFLVEGKSLIKIETNSYPSRFNWRILSLTKEELVVKRELTEQEKEHQELMKLYGEFYEMAISKKCEDVNDWLYTAYGSKACGGPQGYIAYNKTIDVDLFLSKVEEYNKLEEKFNIKWEIISTCDIIPEPKEIECINNYPALKY